MRYYYSATRNLLLILGITALSWEGFAQGQSIQEQLVQDQLHGEQWLQLETENFQLFSQLSSRQTTRIANNLEKWRKVAATTISHIEEFPKAKVPNFVYLFQDLETLTAFVPPNEAAFFSSNPRANYLAMAAGEEDSISQAFHHYVHFLVRNFSDLRMPRWYEEGLASYIARMDITGREIQFDRFRSEELQRIAELSSTFSMQRLLYQNDALASPRVIQIANIKSEFLLHYLLHAYQEPEFIDRREQLQEYLGLLLAGRNSRFAFDQAFDVTAEQLDEEFHAYLVNSRRPRATIEFGSVPASSSNEPEAIAITALASALAELALNSGHFSEAELFFSAAKDSDVNFARGFSGLGDSLRMQELESRDQEIARYFVTALELAPNNPNILLDYGEYWEAELLNCEKVWPEAQRELIVADIEGRFTEALTLSPNSPEANFAMGRLYLLEGKDWSRGLAYQEKVFEQLPADTFVMEQAVRYAINAEEYAEAERLIDELAEPIHFYGEPGWVTDLRVRLLKKRRGEVFDECASN